MCQNYRRRSASGRATRVQHAVGRDRSARGQSKTAVDQCLSPLPPRLTMHLFTFAHAVHIPGMRGLFAPRPGEGWDMTPLAYVALAVWCALLTVSDVRERRLPNRSTGSGALAVLGYALFTKQFTIALLGALLLSVPYLLVHLLTPGAL